MYSEYVLPGIIIIHTQCILFDDEEYARMPGLHVSITLKYIKNLATPRKACWAWSQQSSSVFLWVFFADILK